ncbi:hypothetical protein DFH07DRAFT_1068085 [Mycena maculata]|uniref:BTB domain-containing protein n=1 Tax=Mycena maculata TaxID=230809 RepID=A0AAD7MHU7_9AGAR|nr:hypothetical protein DFH07DRAFT_1068085 [Mycena maculata]
MSRGLSLEGSMHEMQLNGHSPNTALLDRPLQLVRDERFYYPSGDCIIRIENTLFKIHKFHLVNNSPIFSGMFELPVGGTPEGSSDDLPIFLQGDTASDFRSLLKYISMHLNTQIMLIRPSELPHVIAVTRLAHKYDLAAWQKWAFLVVASHFKTQAPKSLTSYDLATIYRLCGQARWNILRDEITEKWVQRIEREPDLSAGDAMDAADAHHDRAFLTRLYSLQLGRMGRWQPSWIRGPSPPMSRFRCTSLPFNTHPTLCNPLTHSQKCIPHFKSCWVQAMDYAETEDSVLALATRLRRAKQFITSHREVERVMPGIDPWRCFDEFFGGGRATTEDFG